MGALWGGEVRFVPHRSYLKSKIVGFHPTPHQGFASLAPVFFGAERRNDGVQGAALPDCLYPH